MKLIIGDRTEYLANYAKTLDESAYLIDTQNFNQTHRGSVAYTSLADLPLLNFINLISKFDFEIEYFPPDTWSSQELKNITERELLRFAYWVNIKGIDLTGEKKINTMFLVDERKTDNAQLWCVGDSITFGIGVTSVEVWTSLVQKELKMPMSSLSHPGSSIRWASDQILRSDIRRDDLVIWGLTSAYRLPFYASNTLNPHMNKLTQKYFNLKNMTDDDIFIEEGLVAIQNVVNYCEKIGAKLLLAGLIDYDDVHHYFKRSEINYIPLHRYSLSFIDLGSDNSHPGPKQHKEYAERILEWIHTQF